MKTLTLAAAIRSLTAAALLLSAPLAQAEVRYWSAVEPQAIADQGNAALDSIREESGMHLRHSLTLPTLAVPMASAESAALPASRNEPAPQVQPAATMMLSRRSLAL